MIYDAYITAGSRLMICDTLLTVSSIQISILKGDYKFQFPFFFFLNCKSILSLKTDLICAQITCHKLDLINTPRGNNNCAFSCAAHS